MRTIRVTGRGVLKVPPDTTRLTITLNGVYPDYAGALQHSAEDTERLKDTLETLGFPRKDLKTLSFNVDMSYESYQDKKGNYKKRFQGYEFSHVMKLEFGNDNALLGKTLSALANSDLKPEFRISYTVKDAEAVKNELLEKAVRDAKAKAEALTRAAGVSLGEIQSVDYSWGKLDIEFRPVSVPLPSQAPNERARGIAMNIQPDDVEVSDVVTVIWEIS